MAARRESVWWMCIKVKGLNYKLVVTEWSWGYKAQYMEYSQQHSNNCVCCQMGMRSIGMII